MIAILCENECLSVHVCVCVCMYLCANVHRNEGKTKGSNLVDTCEVYVCQMHLDYNTRPHQALSNAVIKHKIV